jgi:AcrR family transcriptional regulator
MDAALDQIADRGVLSGLNLTEVADAAGVKPANIYYWFGSREGLLRAALARELQELAPPAVDGSEPSFAERRLAVFDAISASDRIRLTALMALDDDPDYEPLPHIDASRAFYRSLIDGGRLPPDTDIDAAHLVTVATSIGVAIYADAVARQLGTTGPELRARARAVFATMLDALAGDPRASGSEDPQRDR